MTRYYLRLVLWMIVVLIAATTSVVLIFSQLQERYYRPDLAEQLVGLERELERVLGGKTAEEAESLLASMEGELVFAARVVAPGDEGEAPFIVRIDGSDYVIALSPDPERVRKFKEQQGGYFVVWLLVVGVMVAAAGVFMILPLLRKLRAQERTILKIAEGDLDARAPVGSKDALGQLGGRINQMADRIKELVSSQRDLMHAVSHEMRTPTARIGFGLELLGDAEDADERRKRIEAMQRDLEEMDDLLRELMDYLRFEDKRDSLVSEAVPLAVVVGEAVEKVAAVSPGTVIDVEVDDGAVVDGERRLFRRVMENLVRNAVRHADGKVLVRSETEEGRVTGVAVEDNGKGIPEEERERVFEPFVRLDGSRDRKLGGAGLGLAISLRAMERMGGTIRVEASEALGGARFLVCL